MTHVLAFLGVSVVVIVTPGPDTALTVRNTLLGGSRRMGVLTALGVVSGQAVWSVAAAAGITALVVAFEPAFVAIKLAGAAYLIWLGIQSLRAALGRDGAPVSGVVRGRRDLPAGAAYRQGLLSDLGNPKMAAFFTSLLPQFGSSFAGMLALGLVFATFTLVWLSLYAVAVAKATGFLQRSVVRRALDAVTGLVLVALGLRVATER